MHWQYLQASCQVFPINTICHFFIKWNYNLKIILKVYIRVIMSQTELVTHRIFFGCFLRNKVQKLIIEIKRKIFFNNKESAKLRALRAQLPRCLACLRAHVPTCLARLRAHVPCVLCVPMSSRDITTNSKYKFSITRFPYIFVIVLCLFPLK